MVIIPKWFWNCPLHVENVTALPCEMSVVNLDEVQTSLWHSSHFIGNLSAVFGYHVRGEMKLSASWDASSQFLHIILLESEKKISSHCNGHFSWINAIHHDNVCYHFSSGLYGYHLSRSKSQYVVTAFENVAKLDTVLTVTNRQTDTRFNGVFSRTTWVSRHQKG